MLYDKSMTTTREELAAKLGITVDQINEIAGGTTETRTLFAATETTSRGALSPACVRENNELEDAWRARLAAKAVQS